MTEQNHNFVDTDNLIDAIARIRVRMDDPNLMELKNINEVKYIMQMQDEFEEFFNE